MKVITFGEVMLRLSPNGSLRFMQEPSFRAYFGGSEANTAAALSQMGVDTSFVTKLPDNDIARCCLKELSSLGVDTSDVSFGGKRIGIYYCENGAGIRSGKVIYDRANSSISEADLIDFNIDRILSAGDWFHFTGITPALSDSTAEITKAFALGAHNKGIKVSCDLNYRSKLWSKEKANVIMTSLMPYVDILMANEGSVFDVFGIEAKNDEELSRILFKKFGFEAIALTKRKSENADVNTLSGILYRDGKAYCSPEMSVNIVDRVGGGDAFNAGIIYGIMNKLDCQKTVNIANALNVFKHTVNGDLPIFDFDEIIAASAGVTDGRIRR